MSEHHESLKTVIDWISIATAFGAFIDILPALAAGLSAIWTLMRIIEMVLGKPFADLIWGKKDAE